MKPFSVSEFVLKMAAARATSRPTITLTHSSPIRTGHRSLRQAAKSMNTLTTLQISMDYAST